MSKIRHVNSIIRR